MKASSIPLQHRAIESILSQTAIGALHVHKFPSYQLQLRLMQNVKSKVGFFKLSDSCKR